MSNTRAAYKLLERIIRASADLGDVVFDPVCGCPTTLEATLRLERE